MTALTSVMSCVTVEPEAEKTEKPAAEAEKDEETAAEKAADTTDEDESPKATDEGGKD